MRPLPFHAACVGVDLPEDRYDKDDLINGWGCTMCGLIEVLSGTRAFSETGDDSTKVSAEDLRLLLEPTTRLPDACELLAQALDQGECAPNMGRTRGAVSALRRYKKEDRRRGDSRGWLSK